MLIQPWAEKHDQLESQESRKMWARMAKKILKALSTNKTANKYMQKMTYIIERCKMQKIGTKTKQERASGNVSTTKTWIKSLDAST